MNAQTGEPDRFAGHREKWKFFAATLVRAPADLQQHLGIDEDGFRLVAGPAHADARAYFLYGALDEIRQAGIAIMQWEDSLAPNTPDATDDGVLRVILETFAADQSLRIRKLVEALVDLVSFSTTNENEYFRHLLLLQDLSDLRSTMVDLDEFYSAPSENLRSAAERTFEEIAEVEGAVELARCWYRKEPVPLRDAEVHPANILSSTRVRLRNALPCMTATEKAAIGLSYDRVFGEASRDIHFRPSASRRAVDLDLMVKGISHVAVLGLNAIVRAQRLIDAVPDGANAQLRAAFDANTYPEQLIASLTGGRASVGDFVLAAGDLAEVVDSATSSFGYESYRVQYLAERPLPNVEQDWMLAQHTQRLYTVDEFVAGLDVLVADGTVPESVRDRIREMPVERKREAVREALKAVWAAGLRDHFRGTTVEIPEPPVV